MTSQNTQIIIDQFTKQAIPFSRMPAHSHEAALKRMLEMSGVAEDDQVLDVACGPGLVAMAFAGRVAHVSGIDITRAMVERARELARQKNIGNVSFMTGDVSRLPFSEETFAAVITRYSLHHFHEQATILNEMTRVAKAGGVVMAVDMVLPESKRMFYDGVERMRDPSHVRTLTLEEMRKAAREAKLSDLRAEFYRWEMELETLLKASFPVPGTEELIRKAFREDAGKDNLGVGAHWKDGRICFSYPIMILTGKKRTEASAGTHDGSYPDETGSGCRAKD